MKKNTFFTLLASLILALVFGMMLYDYFVMGKEPLIIYSPVVGLVGALATLQMNKSRLRITYLGVFIVFGLFLPVLLVIALLFPAILN